MPKSRVHARCFVTSRARRWRAKRSRQSGVAFRACGSAVAENGERRVAFGAEVVMGSQWQVVRRQEIARGRNPIEGVLQAAVKADEVHVIVRELLREVPPCG